MDADTWVAIGAAVIATGSAVFTGMQVRAAAHQVKEAREANRLASEQNDLAVRAERRRAADDQRQAMTALVEAALRVHANIGASVAEAVTGNYPPGHSLAGVVDDYRRFERMLTDARAVVYHPMFRYLVSSVEEALEAASRHLQNLRQTLSAADPQARVAQGTAAIHAIVAEAAAIDAAGSFVRRTPDPDTQLVLPPDIEVELRRWLASR